MLIDPAFAVPNAPPVALSTDDVNAAIDHFLTYCHGPGRLLVALSGGGDSVGLLVALCAAVKRRPDCGFTVYAATVDHGLRPGSAEEAETAGKLCQFLGAPHAILKWEGEKPASGIQAAARAARYRLLSDHAQAIDAAFLLAAHNLDDTIETWTMRAERNPDAKARGMAEMVLVEGRTWTARPLLNVRRETIRDYLRDRGVTWSEDPSNQSDRFERVRVRKSVLAAPPDIAGDAEAYARTMAEAAAWLAQTGRLVGNQVGLVDLEGFSADRPAHVEAILALACVLGGNDHRGGHQARARLLDHLAAGAGQMTLERVAFDRRGNQLYLQRENRGLAAISIPAGENAVWDRRFRIQNTSRDTVMVGQEISGAPIFDTEAFQTLPPRVRQLAMATTPKVLPAAQDLVSVRRILTGYDAFLPRERLGLGNVLAKMAGVAHFPHPAFG